MRYLSYKETRTYLSDYWWFNPQVIENFEDKYYEIAVQNKRLPPNPHNAFGLECQHQFKFDPF
jgi:hypothetical protein